jgi:hypothetical protein
MTTVYDSLDSEKNPQPNVVLDWTTNVEYATCYVAGGTLEDLDNRSAVNQILRLSLTEGPLRPAVIQSKKETTVQFTGRVVPSVIFDEALGAAEASWDASLKRSEETGKLLSSLNAEGESSSLAGVQKAQLAQKQHQSAVSDEKKSLLLLSRLRKCKDASFETWQRQFASAQARFLQEKGVKDLTTEQADTIGKSILQEYRLPVIVPGQAHVVVNYRSRVDIPKSLYPWLVSLWSRHRGKAPNLLQFAPGRSVGPGGKPVPLSKEESGLLNKWFKKESELRPFELVARYWLIVSWNRAHPKDKVPLPKGSRSPYSKEPGPAQSKKGQKSSDPAIAKQIADLTELVRRVTEGRGQQELPDIPDEQSLPGGVTVKEATLPTQLAEQLISTHGTGTTCKVQMVSPDRPGVVRVTDGSKSQKLMAAVGATEHYYLTALALEKRVKRLEELLDELEQENIELQSAQAEERRELREDPGPTDHIGQEGSVSPSHEEAEDWPESPPPIWIEEGTGHVWFLEASQLSGPVVGRKFGSTTYYRQWTTAPPNKGKQVDLPPPLVPWETRPSGAAKPKEAGKGANLPVGPSKDGTQRARLPDPLAGQNPLRAKGTPRSSLLTEEQKGRLRKALAVPQPEPVDPEQWARMTNKERTQQRTLSALPHWAVTAVLENSGNLELIEQGLLTKDKQTSKLARPGAKKESAGARKGAADAWVSLKGKYPGVPLYSNPSTKREKALKSAFDTLKKEFGEAAALPKPKTKPGSSTAKVGLQGG